MTSGFAAPDPDPPFPATRRLFTEYLELITTPVVDHVADGEPAVPARLRADALYELIATFVEDYGD